MLKADLIKPLSVTEERELFVKARAGDNRSRERLIMSQYKLVSKEAKKFARYQPIEDVIHAGMEGIIAAYDAFDTTRGIRFSTFAITRAKGSMNKFVGTNRCLLSATTLRYEKRWESKNEELKKIAVEQLCYNEDNEDRGLAVGERTDDEDIDAARAEVRVRATMRSVGLTARQCRIIELRYLGDEKQTLTQVGKQIGLSRERVRQLEAKALKLLKDRLADYVVS